MLANPNPDARRRGRKYICTYTIPQAVTPLPAYPVASGRLQGLTPSRPLGPTAIHEGHTQPTL
jgi:hypothetical protein